LDRHFRLKSNPNIYFAGQLSGVEGYVESAASGLMCALNVISLLKGKEMPDFTPETMCGALANYISSANANFQPMNANYAVIKPLEREIGDKKLRYKAYAERSLNKIKSIKENL
jgi:methylenetetrahydrofolate--tRNA-(uracil-5-)-methyltransferase